MKRSTLFATALAVATAAILFGCTTVRTDVGVEGAPANVVTAFKAKYPEATITNVQKQVHDDGRVEYEFEYWNKDGKKHDVELDPQGNFLP